ncbi:M16 family metallopeptidase [Nigerium massiliense]|uniref:M16 family metallopeptidase n=1 Tax=Nigerium massiliense TaxID=1522317 RepID=UPI000A55FF6F|nr:pitrilysin family protein [Nigerium massiliense]
MSVNLAALNYPVHRYELGNGLRVIISPDRGAPVVAVNLWYGVGSKNEAPGATGLAHLFEHLMFQGSANVGSGEHLAILQAHGGSANATTWFDRTNYFEAVPTGVLDLALWLEADRLATLPDALTQENLDTQRDVVKEEKRQRYDNVPYGDVIDRLLRLTFPAGHPYAHSTIGSMDDLDQVSTQTAIDFFRTYYAPNNCVLTLAGDIDVREGLSHIKHFFGGIPAGPSPEALSVPPLPPLDGVPQAAAVAPVPADALYFSWRLPPTGTREFDACEMALDLLGGSQTSRLHRQLVHHQVVAESAGAAALGLVHGTSMGFTFARALEGTGLDQLTDGMITEIERLADEGPTDAEVARGRVQFQRYWLEELARVDRRADLFSQYAMLHGDPELVNGRIAAMSSVTGEEIRDAARTWLSPDNRAVLRYRRGPFGGKEDE